MGATAGFTAGHLRIDLTNIEMSPNDRQDLLRSVRATCIDLTNNKMSASDREDLLHAVQADRIDLSKIAMTGDDQRALMSAVQATVVAHLARQSAVSKVVTISMSPNNGYKPKRKPSRRS